MRLDTSTFSVAGRGIFYYFVSLGRFDNLCPTAEIVLHMHTTYNSVTSFPTFARTSVTINPFDIYRAFASRSLQYWEEEEKKEKRREDSFFLSHYVGLSSLENKELE